MRLKFLASILITSLLAACGEDNNDTAQQDKAAVPQDVSAKIVMSTNAGRAHPLIDLVNRQITEIDELLDTLVVKGTLESLVTRNNLIESKRIELNNLKAEVRREFGANNNAALQKIDSRFLALDNLLAKLISKSPEAQAQAAALAKSEIKKYLAPADDVNGLGTEPISSYSLKPAAPSQPQQESTIPPEYAASRRAPANNLYAFAGNTLLAAPEPVPAEATTCTYNAADLSATQDVQITQEIRDIAEQLNYSPAKIYQWVYNEIRYEPYYGSLKGAIGTLYSKAGGATDQASIANSAVESIQHPGSLCKRSDTD